MASVYWEVFFLFLISNKIKKVLENKQGEHNPIVEFADENNLKNEKDKIHHA